MIGHVYCWRNRVSEKRYIGQTIESVQRRWRKHVNDANKLATDPLHRAIRKHGEDAFDLEWVYPIEVFDVSSDFPNEPNIKTSLDMAEVMLIEHWDTFEGEGYNATAGGRGTMGYRHSLQRRVKCVPRQYFEAPEEYARCRGKGDPEHGARMLTYCDGDRAKHAENCVAWRKTASPEKLSEHARKSIARSGKSVPRPVRCIELGLTFRSAHEAAREVTGAHQGLIWACLHGRRKTHCGYHWEFVK